MDVLFVEFICFCTLKLHTLHNLIFMQFLIFIIKLSSFIFISDECSWYLVNFVFVTSMFFSWFPICLVYLKMWQILWTLNWNFTLASFLSCLPPLIYNYGCCIEKVGFMIVELHFIIHALLGLFMKWCWFT